MKHLQERAPWEAERAELIDELCEYAECSGFSNFYEKKVKGLSEETFMKLYSEVLGKPYPQRFVREENLEELKKNYIPVVEFGSYGPRYVSPEKFVYSTNLYIEFKNGTAAEWDIDLPFDITKADFGKVKTKKDLLDMLYDMVVVEYCDDDPLLLRETLEECPDFEQFATISVQVDQDYYDEPKEDDMMLDDDYWESFVGYDFVQNQPLEKAPNIQTPCERMICELVAKAEESEDYTYFDRVLKYKTDEEIIEMYFSIMWKEGPLL